MQLSNRLLRMGKLAAMGWFGFFVFAVVFYLTLPYERFKDALAARLASAGYVLEAKHAGPSLGLGMTLEEATLISQSAGAAKPTRILIDKATFGVSLLSYLFGSKHYSLAADVFQGEIHADVKTGKEDASAKALATEIDLADLPWVKNAINLPTSGKLDLSFDIDLPKRRPSEAQGQLGWSCTACAVGDGKAKLVIASHPLLAEGLGLPRIRLGDFSGRVVIDKGVGRLQSVNFKSQDLEASIEGEIHLAQPLATSRVDLYVRFKLSDTLLRSSEKLRMIMDLTAQMGKRTDGFLGFRTTGTFANMGSAVWLKTSPFNAAPVPSKPVPPPRPPVPPAAPPPAPPPPQVPIVLPPPLPPPPAPAPAPPPPPVPAPVPVAAPPPPPPPPAAPLGGPPAAAPMPSGVAAPGVGPGAPTSAPAPTPAAPVPPVAPAPPSSAPGTAPVPGTAPAPAPTLPNPY